ncbi:YeeE/YedE family protein [Halomonas campisalis]|uniref:YeeE/YedE family protein n=1 Tax=Billgrantia campisalis TaxID=74661 RepID=A0ABS9P8X6_9GAMM|nr:YeeE/YedE family protein [Halomonas campisalis]MCG6658209.1 YeeE/YedE family protein [Halomonas campisalis]MDR5862877.1 YeeE/YedE family protein [Halomonas campisalis]
MSHTELVVWSGLAIGLLFGATGQATGFCLTRGLVNAWRDADTRKLRGFALAMAVALLGSQALVALGVLSLGDALYLTPSPSWLAVPLGGVLFGYGMVLANGCGARSLVLLAGGNLRSFVVLVCLGLAAYMTLSGVLAPLRVWLEGITTLPLPARDLPRLLGLPAWLPALVIGGALAGWALAGSAFRASPRDWLGGSIIGALVPAGWYVTGVVGFDDFEPVRLATLTFIAPIGETLQYLMLATGTRLGFGVSVVAGVVAGALITALARRDLRLRGFDGPQHMLRSMAGGTLMGIGGVMALGCSIGQGLSGFSTLSLATFAALAGILAGARLGISSPLALSKQ